MLSLLLNTPGKNIQSAEAHELLSHWLEGQNPPLRLSTKRNYLILWGRFVTWVEQQGLILNQVTEQHVIQFLSSLERVNRPQKERYRLIIYRGFSAIQEKANPAEPSAVKDVFAKVWRDGGANQSKQFLTPQEQRHLIETLGEELKTLKDTPVSSNRSLSLWKRKRNATIVALALGCGLKSLELLSIRCDAFFKNEEGVMFIDTDRLVEFSEEQELALVRTNPRTSTIHAYIHDFGGKARVLEVPAWCSQWIDYWLEERGQLLHDVMFPANKEKAKRGLMNPATLVRSISSWGDLHGFTLTAQKLRNSFGGRLVEADKTIVQISHQMGFVIAAGGASRLVSEWNRFIRQQDKGFIKPLDLDLDDLV